MDIALKSKVWLCAKKMYFFFFILVVFYWVEEVILETPELDSTHTIKLTSRQPPPNPYLYCRATPGRTVNMFPGSGKSSPWSSSSTTKILSTKTTESRTKPTSCWRSCQNWASDSSTIVGGKNNWLLVYWIKCTSDLKDQALRLAGLEMD